MLSVPVLISQLKEEHELIDQVLGALRTFIHELRDSTSNLKDREPFMRFFHQFAGHFHHGKEESVLFPALVNDVGLPSERGPIAMLTVQHGQMGQMLDELEQRLRDGYDEKVDALAVAYSHALWVHIDVENSVFLPEAETRLIQHGIHQLLTPTITDEQLVIQREGRALVERYRPYYDPKAMRGEGCVVCPNYGMPCEGIEREWWSELEWEDFFHRVG